MSLKKPIDLGAQLLAKIRAAVTPAQAVKSAKGNAKAPISEPDQATVRQYIEQNEPAWMLMWYDLSIQTGWRTADVANLTYDSISWDEGTATIVISKQSKAAQSRALSRGIREIQETHKQTALIAGNTADFMKWSTASRNELLESATPEQLNRINSLIDNAKIKTDTKPLTDDQIARLKAMREANFMDNLVFSRFQTVSNRTRMVSGFAITRGTFWQRMRQVFRALADVIENAAKLAAYSTRKTFAVNVYNAGGRDIAKVMQAMNHSSPDMSMRYMGMSREVDKLLVSMAGRGAA